MQEENLYRYDWLLFLLGCRGLAEGRESSPLSRLEVAEGSETTPLDRMEVSEGSETTPLSRLEVAEGRESSPLDKLEVSEGRETTPQYRQTGESLEMVGYFMILHSRSVSIYLNDKQRKILD